MSETQKPIPSPCVSICALNEEDICGGCYRTADEIRRWGLMSEEEKKTTLSLVYEREKAVNPFL